jgi:polyhydroxyalkanoate synthesis regulator protein
MKVIKALVDNFKKGDARLSHDVALTEAILNQVIIELDNKGKIPASKLVDSN